MSASNATRVASQVVTVTKRAMSTAGPAIRIPNISARSMSTGVKTAVSEAPPLPTNLVAALLEHENQAGQQPSAAAKDYRQLLENMRKGSEAIPSDAKFETFLQKFRENGGNKLAFAA